MKSLTKSVLLAFVVSITFVGCGGGDGDIHVKSLDLSNDKTALQGITGPAGDHVNAALAAAEAKDFKTALSKMIEAVNTKKLTTPQMESLHQLYTTIQGYLSAFPEERNEEVVALEQKYSRTWEAAFKG